MWPKPHHPSTRSGQAWVDPSGYTLEPALGEDLGLLSIMYAMHDSIAGALYCAMHEECRGAQALMNALGSKGANFMAWTAENLQQALFGTYPHQPTPVDPGLLVLSLGLSNTPIWGDLYMASLDQPQSLLGLAQLDEIPSAAIYVGLLCSAPVVAELWLRIVCRQVARQKVGKVTQRRHH